MSEQRTRDEHDEAVDTVAYALEYDLPATRLLPFHRLTSNSEHLWHRWVEQHGGLLMHAGTVTPVAFACATLPRRLVKRRNGARQRQRAVTQAELQRTPKVTEGRNIGRWRELARACI